MTQPPELLPVLLPEQLRALGYVRKRGSEAKVEGIRARVRATYEEFENLVAAISDEVAGQHRPTSLWSIQEVVDHLVESDRPAVAQLASLLAGKSVDSPIPASLQSARPLDHDWSALRAAFRTVHGDLLALLDGASDDIPLGATAPVQMVVKCAQPDGSLLPVSWVERFDWKAYAILLHAHNREHIAQVQRILASLAPQPGTSAAPTAS
jgi:hypothetical protein